jgi:hypothetical protein
MRKHALEVGARYLLALLLGAVASAALGASLGKDLRVRPDDARDAPPAPQLIADMPVGAPDLHWRG